MIFCMSGKNLEFKTYFVPSHNMSEVAPGMPLSYMANWPAEGFIIYISGATMYDTDLDDRLTSPASPWVRNEFNHSHCGVKDLDGVDTRGEDAVEKDLDLKECVEEYLLKHSGCGDRFRRFEAEKEPILLEGDNAKEYRLFKKKQRAEAARVAAAKEKKDEKKVTA